MKKFALVLILIVCATSAQAQWRANNIGMYLDTTDVDSYCGPLAGAGAFNVYILGTNMNTSSCKGVEFELRWEGNYQVSDWTFPEGIDFGAIVRLTTPSPTLSLSR